MYGLPASADLTFLRGLALTQVCFGENEVILRFDEGVEITVETNMALLDGNGGSTERLEVATELVGSVGATVEHVEWGTSGRVVVAFAGRPSRLEIVDDNAHYESYQIYVGKEPRYIV
ncbi:hypothetical protein ICW40_09210 [Actinotalea ferrariae]|uniref:DUF6188 family protein n=1 Tax=Actinotalea ferrariae TaxID=1386098 RepID=UPI001C8C0ED6|nr:DUF6188 family protein [Actinotalea ferrariae]MBX9244987.1 hypothetical protein [Actinotalea ferrariae]